MANSTKHRLSMLAFLAVGVMVGGLTGADAQEVRVTPGMVLELDAPVTVLGFSSDGTRLVAGDRAGGLGVWDLEAESRLLSEADSGADWIFASFLAGDTAIVTVTESGGIEIRPVASGGEAARLETAGRPAGVALDASRRTLAVLARNDRIEIFDLPTRQRIGEIDARRDVDDLIYLGFDRQGRQLLAVSTNGRGTAWNPGTFEPLRRVTLQSSDLQGSRTVVHAAGTDRNANILVAALEEVALPRGGLRGMARPDDLVRRDYLLVFDWYSGAEIRRVPVIDGVAEVLAVGPGNDHAIVTYGPRVTLMDLRGGERGASITAASGVTELAVSSDQTRLAVGSEGGEVAVWNMEYRERTVADALDAPPEGIGSRLRILGESSPAIEPGTDLTLAVLPFDDRDSEGRLSRTVAEILTTQLANVPGLRLVERLRIDALIAEQNLQEQGITEPGGLELGRMLNADYVLLGNVGASGTTLTFGARLLNVETGEVVSGRQVLCEDCHARDLFDAIHLLGTAIARP
jgi:TolB-like protein